MERGVLFFRFELGVSPGEELRVRAHGIESGQAYHGAGVPVTAERENRDWDAGNRCALIGRLLADLNWKNGGRAKPPAGTGITTFTFSHIIILHLNFIIRLK